MVAQTDTRTIRSSTPMCAAVLNEACARRHNRSDVFARNLSTGQWACCRHHGYVRTRGPSCTNASLSLRIELDKLTFRCRTSSRGGCPTAAAFNLLPRPFLSQRHVHSIVARTRLAIGSIVRDLEAQLWRSFDALRILGGHFADYRLFFVENDSTDGTRALLSRLVKQGGGRVAGAYLSRSPLHSTSLCSRAVRNCRRRSALLGSLRAEVIELATRSWSEWTALLMVDVDFVTFSIPNYLYSFATGHVLNASAIFANSMAKRRGGYIYQNLDFLNYRPYDTASLRRVQAAAKENSWFALVQQWNVIQEHSSHCLARVRSGFGGFGTYWRRALEEARPAYNFSCSEEHGHNNDHAGGCRRVTAHAAQHHVRGQRQRSSTHVACRDFLHESSRTPEHVPFNVALHECSGGLFVDPSFQPVYAA